MSDVTNALPPSAPVQATNAGDIPPRPSEAVLAAPGEDHNPKGQVTPPPRTSRASGGTPAPFDRLPRDRQLEVVRGALRHCTPRGVAGSGTYPAAFDVLRGLVHGLGAQDAADLAQEWSPTNLEAGWDVAHKVTEIAKQTRSEHNSIGCVFWHAKRGGWKPPDWLHSQTLALNRVDATAILRLAIRSGVGPADLSAICAELTVISPCRGSTLSHIVRAEEKEVQQEEAMQEASDHQRRLVTISKLQQGITLEGIFPVPLTGALRVINRYQAWPDTLMISTVISTGSGLLKIGSKVLANPLQRYEVPMNLFHAVVGKTGRGKTPLDHQLVSGPIAGLIAKVEKENDIRSNTWWLENKDLPKHKREPEPQSRYVAVQEYSGEKLTATLAVHDADKLGLLVRVDELAGLFKRLNQYRQGGTGGDEEQLLEAWDGGAHRSIRIKGDRCYSACHVSITGGIQDEVLTRLLADGDGGNGRWARFLFSPLPYREPIAPPLDPTDEEISQRQQADEFLESLAGYLYGLEPRTYALDRDSRQLFQAFDISRREDAERAALQSHAALLGKSSGKVLRVAGLLHLVHAFTPGSDATPGHQIPQQRVLDAIQLVEYFDNWAMSLHTLAASPLAAETNDLLRSVHRIASKSKMPVPWHDLRRQLSSRQRLGLSVHQGVELFAQLERLGLGDTSTGSGGGLQFQANDKQFPG